jgi:hypothetical protein
VPTIRTPAVFAPVRVCARYGFLAIRSFSPPCLGRLARAASRTFGISGFAASRIALLSSLRRPF